MKVKSWVSTTLAPGAIGGIDGRPLLSRFAVSCHTVTDDAFCRPNYEPLTRRQPRLGDPLWQTQIDGRTWSAELRFHGESYGWEAQILRDRELVISHRFVLLEHAERWAREKRTALEKDTGGT